MAQRIEWEKVEQPQLRTGSGQGGKNSRSGRVMKLEANKTYRVRPLLKPIMYYRVMNQMDGGFRYAIVDDPQKHPIFEKYPKLKASVRFATLVFDRGNENQLQFLEGPGKLFEAFKHYKNMTKKEPGGPESGDFQIQVVCLSGKKDRNTTYKVEFLEQVKFTKAEHEQYQTKKAEYDLVEFYKPNTLEEAESRLFKVWEDRTQGGAGQVPATTQEVNSDVSMEEPVAAGSSAGGNDENFAF